MTQALIEIDKVGKKFCRSLKRSLWYGLMDVASEVTGRQAPRTSLRTDEFWAIEELVPRAACWRNARPHRGQRRWKDDVAANP